MSTIRKLLMLGLTASLSMVGAQAVAQETPNADIEGTISVWTWPNNDRTFEALKPAFNEAYPNISVEIQGYPAADNVYLNNLQRAMLTGNGPDVAMIEIAMMAQLREREQWADLSQEPFNATGENFADFTWNNVVLDSGKVVALPKHTGPGGFFYRSDIFEQAGLPSDSESVGELISDWDAFYEVGQELAIPNERWVVGSGEEIVRAYLAQNGLHYFDADGNLNFDEPAMTEAFELVARFAEAGLISPFSAWTPEWQGAFARGQLASVMYGNWFGGLLKRAYAPDDAGLWRVTHAPAAPNGNSAFNSGGDYIGILENSDNKEAAWAFVTWIVSNADSLRQQYENDDLYPAWTPATESDWINFEDPYYGGQNVNAVFSEVQSEMVPFVLNPLDSVAQNALQTAVDNVVRGVMGPEEALAQATATVQAQM